MIKHSIRFVLIGLLLTAVLIPFNYFLLEAIFEVPFGRSLYLSYAYFLLLTIGIQIYLQKSIVDQPKRFVTRFMATMGGKIFLSLILLVVHLYTHREEARLFAVNFTVLYLLYSLLGTYYILQFQSKQKEG